MGSSSSKNTNNNEWEIAEKRAIKVYNYRITHFRTWITRCLYGTSTSRI